MDACQTVMFMYALGQWERGRGGVAFFWRKEAKQSFILLNRAAFWGAGASGGGSGVMRLFT